MLLSLMRKHAKSWIIKILIAMIIMVFIFFFGYSYISNEGEKVAEVNGEAISYVEYQNAYRELLKNCVERSQLFFRRRRLDPDSFFLSFPDAPSGVPVQHVEKFLRVFDPRQINS